MMQPGRANVGAAMIALGAEHPWLQIVTLSGSPLTSNSAL
jgi:hypothetical protein